MCIRQKRIEGSNPFLSAGTTSTGDTDWKLFEPSKFIYSYFTFNMIYEIDWIESPRRRNENKI